MGSYHLLPGFTIVGTKGLQRNKCGNQGIYYISKLPLELPEIATLTLCQALSYEHACKR